MTYQNNEQLTADYHNAGAAFNAIYATTPKDEILKAKFIGPSAPVGTCAPVFEKHFNGDGIVKATLQITAKGVYEANLNGQQVGDFFLAPGWTEYFTRIQYQSYDITPSLQPGDNLLQVTVGWGWFFHRVYHQTHDDLAMIAALILTDGQGNETVLYSGKDWQWGTGPSVYDDFYKGETYDSNLTVKMLGQAAEKEFFPREIVAQEGEIVREMERFPAKRLFVTPKGETVLDFGQNLSGHVAFTVTGKKGETVSLRHAEVLDKDGNFYLDNIRAADNRISFVCDGTPHTFKSRFTFQGFRFVRLEGFTDELKLENFTAVSVYADMPRTGYFRCGHEGLNQLYSNQLWGQRSNYVDLPTDCNQRDERQGWIGDARMFSRAGMYNYNTDRFMRKWLKDIRYSQSLDGRIPPVAPLMDFWWDPERFTTPELVMDVVYIAWHLYRAYGDTEVLEEMFDCLRRAINWMRSGMVDGLYVSCRGNGDWLGLDSEPGSYTGATSALLWNNAFGVYALDLFTRICRVLGNNATEYEEQYRKSLAAFRNRFMTPEGRMVEDTQTACVLTLHFGLTEKPAVVAKQYRDLLKKWGHRTTGMGSPFDLHALSDYVSPKLAWDMLLTDEFPSWLYAVKKGATTMWEHWDGIMPDGSMWSPDMNSFNHHACGAFADWLYGDAAGINPDEKAPGYRHIFIRPIPDARVGWLEASMETAYGKVASAWRIQGDTVTYTFTVPEGATAEFKAPGLQGEYAPGTYTLTGAYIERDEV